MKRAELIKEMADKMGMSKAQTAILFEEMFICLKILLDEGNTILIPKFGKFEVIDTNPIIGRNPQTGETINVPSKRKLRFKTSLNMKKYLNRKL